MVTLEDLSELEEIIGYSFKNKDLLLQAVTHSSFANEQRINKKPDYERLEYLGDAVLELVTSQYLYRKYPEKREGELTRMRAALVCETALVCCAEEIGIGRFMRLGKGEEATGGRNRDSIIADVMEAVIGAIYLDSGIRRATAHIERFVLSDSENKQKFYDSKTKLQEYVQANGHAAIRYEVIEQSGPDHDRTFRVAVYIGDDPKGEGEGKTKKAAEQKAAYEAILQLKK